MNLSTAKKSYFILAVIAGTCWGTHGSFAALMGEYGISDGSVSFLAPLFYGLFFFFLLCKDDIRKIKIPFKWIPAFVMYGLVVALYNYSIIKAYWHLPVGIVHTVVFSSLFLVILVSRVVFKDPLTWQKAVASVTAVFGIMLLLNVFSGGSWDAEGLVWLVLAWLSWTAVVILEKYFITKGFDGNAVVTYSGLFGTVIIGIIVSPVTVVTEVAASVVSSHGMVLLPMLGFAVITSAGANYFYLAALRRVKTIQHYRHQLKFSAGNHLQGILPRNPSRRNSPVLLLLSHLRANLHALNIHLS